MKKIIFIVSLFLIGCVQTQIVSRKADGFTEKISKLYILVRGSDKAHPFFIAFTKSIVDDLSKRNIPSEVYYFDPLSLKTEKDLIERINTFNPNMVMHIDQTESRNTSSSYGWGSTNTGGTFDVKIFKPDSERPVWRANLQADASLGLETSAKKASQRLREKLIADGFLP
ncbi:hypothetical protein ACTJIJ_16090 [Niabella sp. 22666]|uniref:hypothetical protein n=1 Tax=Niabella sp. 22666 TaxID=3453954 RepID=UPI003F85195A